MDYLRKVVDIYNPKLDTPAGPDDLVLNEVITKFELDVSTIAGSQSSTIAFEEFEATLGEGGER